MYVCEHGREKAYCNKCAPDIKLSGLEAVIENGELRISIGVDTLCFAVETGRGYGLGDITITDKQVFIQDILNEINREAEDGSTMVHQMLDKATSDAIENGAQGAEYSEL